MNDIISDITPPMSEEVDMSSDQASEPRQSPVKQNVASFSKSQQLRRLFSNLVNATSQEREWNFNVQEISPDLTRGQIAKALFDMGNYVNELINADKEPGDHKNIYEVLHSSGDYVITLFLEAEWLCLSKGFSASCISYLRLLPEPTLRRVIMRSVNRRAYYEKENIHRRISDIYALAMCDDFLALMGDEDLRLAMNLMVDLGLEEQVDIEQTVMLSASDTLSYHKSRMSVLKAMNTLLLKRGRKGNQRGVNRITGVELRKALYTVVRVLSNTAADRDILCQCGVSAIALVHFLHYIHKPQKFERALYDFLSSHEQLKRKFEGIEKSMAPMTNDKLMLYDVANTKHLVRLLLDLPSLGCLSVIRGILTFVYSNYGKHEGKNATFQIPSSDTHTKEAFVTTIVHVSHKVLKTAAECSTRVDLNFATLQGIQLLLQFITKDTFDCPETYQCLTELPELIITFWTKKVRRVSNIAIGTSSKLMEISFKLAEETSNPLIMDFTKQLVQVMTKAFGSNLKLKYLSLQHLLRYVGPEEILRLQPFLIPHLLCSLSVPAIKGCATVFLTELLTSIYSNIQDICVEENTGQSTPLLAFHCLIYPTVIAILHSRQLVVPSNADGKLIPRADASPEELELRVSGLADSFKNIFGKIQREYVFEMLRLSTAFTKCDFYQYLPDSERESLTSVGDYVVEDLSNLREHLRLLINHIVSIVPHSSEEQIIHLREPFNLAESMCLCDARGLSSMEFVDAELDGVLLRGAVINDSPSVFKFDPSKLHCLPQVRLFYVPSEKIRDGLGHIKTNICLNVLKAITCSPKIKHPISSMEMGFIIYALNHCMKTSSPSFRQHFVASIKPFVKRIYNILTEKFKLPEGCLKSKSVDAAYDSAFELERSLELQNTDPVTDPSQVVDLHFRYMQLFLKTLVATINPCASDFKNTTALELLLMTFTVFAENPNWETHLNEIFSQELIVTLYMALFYISTRQQDLIFKILKLLPANRLCRALEQKGGDDALGYICRKSAASLWSVKTMPYVSGAKALTLLFRAIPPTREAELAIISGDLRSAILMACKGNENLQGSVFTVLDYLMRQLGAYCAEIEKHIDVNNPEESSSPAGLLSLYSHYMDSIPISVYATIATTERFVNYLDGFYENVKSICDRILKYVGREYDLDQAEKKPYQIDCRGHLISKESSYDFDCISNCEEGYMDCRLCHKGFFCYKANFHGTPKCSIPDDSNLRPFTVLCWKTMLESCEAMRAILQWILPQTYNGSIALGDVRASTFEDPGTNVPLLYGKINVIGHYVISSLMSCRHFGCTDALADLLTWICKKLVILGLQCLLKEWVTVLLDLLKGYSVTDQQWSELFVMLRDSHRRSEPIGRAFTSILKAESDRHKPVLLPMVVETLLELCNAERPFVSDPKDGFTVVDIRIHSLNILCALFKCKELKWSNNVHAGEALCASLKNMSHGDWSVRNSASLMFSSVMQLLVGNDVNASCTEALLDQKIGLCDNKPLTDELNRILVSVYDMTVVKSETYEKLNPPQDYSALYQSSTFVFNLLSRIPLYSFPADVSLKLSENVVATLYSSNAAIRAMAAKILAKNYMEGSRSSISEIIIDRCKIILSELQNSNRINGLLLLIRELIDTMASNGLYDDFRFSGQGPGTIHYLSRALDFYDNHLNEIMVAMSSWDTANALLITMYLVMVKTNCFENAMLATNILERLCLAHTRSETYNELVLSLANGAIRSFEITECMTLLGMYCAQLIDEKTETLFFETIKKRTLNEIVCKNNTLQRLTDQFSRLRDDNTIKAQAASTLVRSVYIATLDYKNDSSEAKPIISPFVRFASLLLHNWSFATSSSRMIEAVLNDLSFLVSNDKFIPKLEQQLISLWDAGITILSATTKHFVIIAVFKLLNELGLRSLWSGKPDPRIFELLWTIRFRKTASERLMNNQDFMIESWKSCHLHAMLHCMSLELNTRVLEVAAGLLMRIADPRSDITMRRCGAQFLKNVPLKAPIEGVYRYGKLSLYVLHVIGALMILLQDENEQVRSMAVSSCDSLIQNSIDYEQGNMNAQLCMHRLLEFTVCTMPTDWVTMLFQQLTMLKPGLYNPVNYNLQSIHQTILQDRIFLTTAVLPSNHLEAAKVPKLSVLAEMDEVFKFEPQNMYTEPILYMVYVDRLLCKAIQGAMDPSTAILVPESSTKQIGAFLTNASFEAMEKLMRHLSVNYAVDIENIEGHKSHAIASDPMVTICSVVGFSRSCLSVLWPGNTDIENREETLKMFHSFRKLLSIAGRVWYNHVIAVSQSMSSPQIETCRTAKLEVIAALEQFLNLF